MNRYSEQLDELDASVFSGEILFTNFEELKECLKRWQIAVDDHEKWCREDEAED